MKWKTLGFSAYFLFSCPGNHHFRHTFSIKAISNKASLSRAMSSLSICQQDAYAKASKSRVVSSSLHENDNRRIVVLEDCILYPEGGGQPSDFGLVDGKRVVSLSKSLQSPTAIEAVLDSNEELTSDVVDCQVDWDRRYDFMQHHTGQHLLSACAFHLFGADTIGWYLGQDIVTVDLNMPSLSGEQTLELENMINAHIRNNDEVSWKIYSRQDLSTIENLRGAPKGAAMDLEDLRIIRIGDLDANPCGGTHLRSLSELQVLKILGIDKEKTWIRLRFVCGNRALAFFRESVSTLQKLSSSFSTPASALVESLEKMSQERRDLQKDMKYLSEQHASLLGYEFLKQLKDQPSPVLVYHYSPLEVAKKGSGYTKLNHFIDINFLIACGDLILTHCPQAVVFLSAVDDSLSSNGTNGANNSGSNNKKANKKVSSSSVSLESLFSSLVVNAPVVDLEHSCTGNFILFGEPSKIQKVQKEIMDVIGGRGGGRPGRLQGTAANLQDISSISRILHDVQV